MKIKDLVSKVLEFAEANKDGFTLNIRTLQPVTSGFVVSYRDTQNSFSANDLQSVVAHALTHDCVVGGWYNTEDGRYYFDSNKVFAVSELSEAIQFGIENEQIAIFSLDSVCEIRLNNQSLTA